MHKIDIKKLITLKNICESSFINSLQKLGL